MDVTVIIIIIIIIIITTTTTTTTTNTTLFAKDSNMIRFMRCTVTTMQIISE